MMSRAVGLLPSPGISVRVGGCTLHGALVAQHCLAVWVKRNGHRIPLRDRDVAVTGEETDEDLEALVLAHGMDLLRELYRGGR